MTIYLSIYTCIPTSFIFIDFRHLRSTSLISLLIILSNRLLIILSFQYSAELYILVLATILCTTPNVTLNRHHFIVTGPQLDSGADGGMAFAISWPAAVQNALLTTQSYWRYFAQVSIFLTYYRVKFSRKILHRSLPWAITHNSTNPSKSSRQRLLGRPRSSLSLL